MSLRGDESDKMDLELPSGSKLVKKLNLGCGGDIRSSQDETWINLDFIQNEGVDVVHDLEKIPYPFSNNEFDYILAQNIIEHLDNFDGAIKELNRILKKKGILDIIVPYHSQEVSEFHKRFFRYNSFSVSNLENLERKKLFSSFKMVKRKIIFRKNFPFWLNIIPEAIFNLHPKIALFYEYTCLRNLFPAYLINYKLKKN